MGEGKQGRKGRGGSPDDVLFSPSFNRAIKVEAGDDRLTSDAGALLVREADHRLGLTESLAQQLFDRRDPTKTRYTLLELLRERIYAFALGYDAQDDLDRLAHDPALKLATWNRPGQEPLNQRLASQPTQSRLVDALADPAPNRAALNAALCDWCQRHQRATGTDHAARHITVDIDSFPIEVHGAQAGGAYHGYYGQTIYHPLVASYSVAGDYDGFQHGQRLGQGFIHAVLREGHVHTADGAAEFFTAVIDRAARLGYVATLRFDAGFAEGELLDLLTVKNTCFLGRIKANARLGELASPHLARPVGRPPKEGYECCVELGMYQAESWAFGQRIILVVIDRPDAKTGQLNLLPDYFFLVTNHRAEELSAEAALTAYRRRGTFEDRLGEFRQAIDPKLSSPTFARNEVTLLLALLAFNLANVLRCELEDQQGGCWDLRRFQRYVLKAGGRAVKHAWRVVVHLAQAVVPLWRDLVAQLGRWRLPSRFPPPLGPHVRDYRPPPRHAFLTEVLRV